MIITSPKGTTTGRPRRCGWLDLPLVQFSALLNGYSSINITKLDVLTGLETIKLGVAYKRKGETLEAGSFPDQLEDLAEVEVVYEDFPGWSEDISKVRTLEGLPKNAQNYMKRCEELLQIPISWIGVGPDREDMFIATK